MMLPYEITAGSVTKTLPHFYRKLQCHTTDHCPIGTGTESITQKSAATLVEALRVPHNRTLSYLCRH